MAVSSKYTQDLSVQIVFFTFSCKWFLCFYFWAVIWSYIVDLFAALHELASASLRTLLKLASSVRALLKPYGDTLSCFLLFGQRASACTFDHLFVRLPSLCLEVCLNFSLPFIQLLLFEQDTSVFYLMYYNIPRVEAPLLVNKISKKTSSQSWRFQVALRWPNTVLARAFADAN